MIGTNGLMDALETFPDSSIPAYALRNIEGDDKSDFLDLKSNGHNYDLLGDLIYYPDFRS